MKRKYTTAIMKVFAAFMIIATILFLIAPLIGGGF